MKAIRFCILPILCIAAFLLARANYSPVQAVHGSIPHSDTLKVMAYNVLNYGDGCQGDLQKLNNYFKTIVKYTKPDLLSCEKIAAFVPGKSKSSNFATVICGHVLNTVYKDRYAYADPSNQSEADNMSVLFYNKQKLAFVKTETLLARTTDFNLYKLYYKDSKLAIAKDTVFLYVLVNHTQSGDNSKQRDKQLTKVMERIREKFPILPNLIVMGDFNTRKTGEDGYQAIVASEKASTKMFDPPFYPDKVLSYPANWTKRPELYERFLTTSTRLSENIPNTCGTGGGAKSWYDHIFISPPMVSGSRKIKYIPNSYRTVGNDGKRLGIEVNSRTKRNTAVPYDLAEALFYFSNKYPVSMQLAIKTR
ncbi:hypothetical protein DBR11_11880 [Pedobacter sp. HMWF019]|uniref:hypothetical protein n=1 Tax=Pedobacter sp. HMWF019 TaxID=2056856 RepID=UPI000D35EC4C|nr:hypothetical protein [Pedobacter sp. HMWF019]PTS99629.1 hypothetical protein DBR11_11880 [Pedobacter sp. HMWF019]